MSGQIDRIALVDLKTAVIKSVAIKIVIVRAAVVVFVFVSIQFDRIQPDNNQLCITLLTGDAIALFDLGIDENFFTAFGANGCWHVSNLSVKKLRIICLSRDDRVRMYILLNLT